MGFSEFLIHRCDIQRASAAQSTSGEITTSWPVATATVPCYVTTVSGKNLRYESGEILEAEAKGLFLPGVDIRPGDRIVVTGGGYNGAILYVILVKAPWTHHQMALLHRGLRKGI